MYLNTLPRGETAIIDRVEPQGVSDPIMKRLVELGFVSGEPVQVIAIGPMGGNPIAVRIGSTRFALRREEAARVHLRGAS
ncbi:FeoA family protein [Brytella acorum]|uniref:FeoA family protein n=1 Tax=Brytella acorum TaxID=2959299 RepID=A0AA35V1E2_9PROT|nr:FeoA family protein [Brytella acorum]MDF3624001.1 FeoA family protein [Brytella acorum]CAI9120896.1 FeoA family protein [Brytella acorum]